MKGINFLTKKTHKFWPEIIETKYLDKFWPCNQNFDLKMTSIVKKYLNNQNFDNFFNLKTEKFRPENPRNKKLWTNFNLKTKFLINFWTQKLLNFDLITQKPKIENIFDLITKIWHKKSKFWNKTKFLNLWADSFWHENPETKKIDKFWHENQNFHKFSQKKNKFLNL